MTYSIAYYCDECDMSHDDHETFPTKSEAREAGEYSAQFHNGCDSQCVKVTIRKVAS